MPKRPNSHQHIGHHMPEGRDGVEVRIWEDDRGYYASTIYNPRGRIPADIGPFDTSFAAITAGLERHGIEFEGRGVVMPMRHRFKEDAPLIDIAVGW